jgi:hypothetical protein
MKPNLDTFSILYPMSEILYKAKYKVKLHDRGIPMTSDAWGHFPEMVGRLRKLLRWESDGIKEVEVFYEPAYFVGNAQRLEALDPVHTFNVKKYKALS